MGNIYRNMKKIVALIFALYVFPIDSISQVIDTIYFNADWKTSDKGSAQYFRKVYAKDKSGVYKVDDCYINGRVQMSGGSLDPYADNDEPFREGKFMFYDSIGNLKDEEYYSKGRYVGKWLSYFTGKSVVSRELNFENDSTASTVYYYLSGFVESKGKQIKGKNEGEWRYFYNEKDKLAEIRNYLHGKKNGVMQGFDSITSKKRADGFFTDDKKEGLWRFYNSDGMLLNEVSFKNDARNGFEIEYDSVSGKRKGKIPYVNDTVNGVVQQFDLETGVLLSDGKVDKGKKVGTWKTYYPGTAKIRMIREIELDSSFAVRVYDTTGVMIVKGQGIKDKVKEGIWETYSEKNSKLVSKVVFHDGKLDGHAEYYDEITGIKYSEGEHVQGARLGKWTFYFHVGGKLKSTETYKGMTLNGPATYYDSLSFKLIKAGDYDMGKKNGIWQYYYSKSGNKKSKGNYLNGSMEDEWTFYYDSDVNRIKSVEWYTDGKANGKFIMYDSLTNHINNEGEYSGSKKTGQWKTYYLNGKIAIASNYTNGALDGEWKMYDSVTMSVIKDGRYKKDKRDGKWLYYNNDGKLIGSEHYLNGMLNGEQLAYDSIGSVVCQFNYVDNVKEGNWRIYYPGTKQIWIDYYFKGDSIDGLLKSYYQSGSLKRSENYHMGKKLDSKCYSSHGEEIECLPILTNAMFKTDVMTYIGDNLTYPESAKAKGTEGKVLVRFIVNENGRVSDVEVIQSIDKECDAEALSLVSHMPPWIPAQVDGIPYKTYQTLPIVFWIH
jgi:TonB family protein